MTITRALVLITVTATASIALGTTLPPPPHPPAPLTAHERGERTATVFPGLAQWCAAEGLGDANDPEQQAEARAIVDAAIETRFRSHDTVGLESIRSGSSRPATDRRTRPPPRERRMSPEAVTIISTGITAPSRTGNHPENGLDERTPARDTLPETSPRPIGS